MPTEQIALPSLIELENKLAGQRMALGRSKKALGEAILMGLDSNTLANTVEAIQKRIMELEVGIETLKQRELDEKALQQAEAKRMHAEVKFDIESNVFQCVQEMSHKIAEIGECGSRLMAACNAGLSLNDDALKYQVLNVTKGFKYFLLHAVRDFPGCTTGVAPFLNLHTRTFAEVFPKPQPAKEKRT